MTTPAATGNVQALPQPSALGVPSPQRPREDAFITVESVASSGLPALFPKVGARQASSYLHKAASKIRKVSDLLPLAEEVFSCGWPDVTIRFQRSGASASDTHSWYLQAPRLDRAAPGRHGVCHAS
ncbi:hypothetical protein SAMN04487954_1242 [Billgrantia gudaonensis]|uniref:Uncharacterized protein n=1 Tax=Billgrantia gudaonensis TaxID=376427 RepID=A0A1G9E255_9GAMM|nr:hypothetical protein SAMN04487954_1242 [Halomonas gudaonensis]